MSISTDSTFKITLIGNSGVGKTMFMLRLIENKFSESSQTTLGAEYNTKIFQISGNKYIKCQIWDTAGQEKFRSIPLKYLRGSIGVMIFYDTTDHKSFNDLPTWISYIDKY